ncbi:MAG TPA: tetratricopeptide repeat protein [Phycisphaerae bacterium]|nr:tetratricopeptide repeat protein [Phycisphaerae bacterium]
MKQIETAAPSGFWLTVAVLVILATGILAYCNSFSGPFIFDDPSSIEDNPGIRNLWDISSVLQARPPMHGKPLRPIVNITLAVNYAISGLNVWSYHVLNLCVHILASLVLFALVRRTLLLKKFNGQFASGSTVLGLIVAVIWLVHPLQTESVTYVIQRSESLMGLFFLLTLYCLLRGSQSRFARYWYAAAVGCCALGMGSKEVMVTAPLVAMVFDRVFLSSSFKQLFSKRWGFYGLLAATWSIPVVLLSISGAPEGTGFGLEDVTPLQYAATQCQVIVHYIRMAFWPDPLVLDYIWPMAEGFGEVWPWASVIVLLLMATILALRYVPAVGFLGVWFFLILAPTSSIMPISDAAFEHRMYLSLAAIIAGTTVGLYAAVRFLGRKLGIQNTFMRRAATIGGIVLAGIAVVSLGSATLRRNAHYSDRITIYQDTADKSPHNYRVWNSLGLSHQVNGNIPEALACYTRVLELKPKYALVYNNRGVLYLLSKQLSPALEDFRKAIELDPEYARAYFNRALVYAFMNKPDLVAGDLAKAEKFGRTHVKYLFHAAAIHRNAGRRDVAVQFYNFLIGVAPSARAYVERGRVYYLLEKHDLAISDFTKAIETDPDLSGAYTSRAAAKIRSGNLPDAIEDLEIAVRLDPSDRVARKNLDRCRALLKKAVQQ